MPPVSVQLSLGTYPCESCTAQMWWALWMRAVSPEPTGWDALRAATVEDAGDVWGVFEMPVIIDQPQATATFADLLGQSDLDGRARHLVPRAPGLPGASYMWGGLRQPSPPPWEHRSLFSRPPMH